MPEWSQLGVWKVFSHMQVSFCIHKLTAERESKHVFHENRNDTDYVHNLYLLKDTASECKSNS